VADATVPRTRQDDGLSLPEELETARLPWLSRLPRRLAALWFALVVLLGVFLAVGTVQIGAGNWIGRRMRISQIWARFTEFLADKGFSGWAIGLVTVAAFVAIIGCAYLLWLAFALQDENVARTLDDSVTK
jgi:hypothetical protein